jgi:hypothetical protein
MRMGHYAAAVLSLLVAGCLPTGDMRDPVPEPLATQAAVEGYGKIRYYSDDTIAMRALAQARIAQIRQRFGNVSLKGRKIDITFLSVSGGGSDGAFGAGFLVGWSEHGTRPEFSVVTGISTGAMIAPLAFLGPKYDPMLREAYTTVSTEDVAEKQVLAAVFGQAPSLASNAPLRRLVAKYMTADMLAEIGVAHQKGRMLLIGTTNLDSQRPVIWDIGAIANSGRPDALELTRDIILASAAIPGVFPPIDIKVAADGKSFVEMHVDGGVTRQVFVYPPGYSPELVDNALGWKPSRRAYIIRNSKVDPQYKETDLKLIPITSRSIDTLIKSQGVGDLYRIYATAQRDKLDYNLIYIPRSFEMKNSSAFDRTYMNALFDLGRDMGRSNKHWEKQPPGMAN